MNAKLKSAVIAAKLGGGEEEEKKKKEAAQKEAAQKEAISKAQSSGTSSSVAEADTSANASIYYRGYDKSGKEVRVSQEEMPQTDDEKTRLAWKMGVRSFSKVTEADAASKQTVEQKKMPPQMENKRSFVRGFTDPNEELKKERFNFRR